MSSVRVALPQILAVMVKNLLVISTGMCTGFPTILIPSLSKENPDEVLHFNESQISWIGALTFAWVPVGCLLSGVATKPFGRKIALQIMCIPLTGCWLIYRFSNAPWQIFIATSLGGFSGGLFEAPLITYVTEISQPHLRGALGATAVLSLLFGHLLSYILATFLYWRTIALWSILLPIIAFFSLFFIPESPHWLIMKDRLIQARTSLAWLRGWGTLEEIELEFQELYRIRSSRDLGVENPNMKMQFLRKFFKKSFLKPLALLAFIFFISAFTGASTIQTYAVKIFATLEVPVGGYYATVILGTSVCLGSIVCITLISFLGKRIIAFVSMIVAGFSFIIVATYAQANDIKYFNNPSSNNTTIELKQHGWVPLLFLNLSAFISYSGLKIVPWILIGEVYPIETRITGSGISTAISYSFIFLINKLFLKIVALITLPGVFWFYGGLSLIGFIVLYFVLPETEGKSLQEISDHFAGVKKLDNRVRRRNQIKVREQCV